MTTSADLSELLNHAQDKIVVLDDRGRVTYANDAVSRILGWELEEFIGQNALEFIHPEDANAVQTAFEQTIDAEEFSELTIEYRHRTKEGSWVWFESRMSNATSDQLDGYVISSRNITDRVEAQRAKQQTQSRLQEISSAASEVLWIFDSDWSKNLFVNAAYEDVYGQPIDTLQADPTAVLDTVHPEDVSIVKNAIKRLTAGESVDIEYRVNPSNDYSTRVWVRGDPIFQEDDVVRIVGFSRDITDRYLRERQLYVMDNLLRHNLRNDLNVILGWAQAIEETAPGVAELASQIQQAGEKLLTTAEKERDMIDVLTNSSNLKQIDLVNILKREVGSLQTQFPKACISVSSPEAAQALVVEQIDIAIHELLENAIIHSEIHRPTVEVSVESTRDQVAVIVRDEAPAIPEIESQVLTGKHGIDDIYHSTGLGLWLIYWVVEISDGKIEIDSDPVAGNQIRLSFPSLGK